MGTTCLLYTSHTPAGSRVIYDENNIVIYKRAFDVDGKPVSTTMTDYEIAYTQQDGTGGGEAGSFTITGLPALGENEAYDIYYTARLQDAVDTSNGYIDVYKRQA